VLSVPDRLAMYGSSTSTNLPILSVRLQRPAIAADTSLTKTLDALEYRLSPCAAMLEHGMASLAWASGWHRGLPSFSPGPLIFQNNSPVAGLVKSHQN
jgi:hypothetical protein